MVLDNFLWHQCSFKTRLYIEEEIYLLMMMVFRTKKSQSTHVLRNGCSANVRKKAAVVCLSNISQKSFIIMNRLRESLTLTYFWKHLQLQQIYGDPFLQLVVHYKQPQYLRCIMVHHGKDSEPPKQFLRRQLHKRLSQTFDPFPKTNCLLGLSNVIQILLTLKLVHKSQENNHWNKTFFIDKKQIINLPQ